MAPPSRAPNGAGAGQPLRRTQSLGGKYGMYLTVPPGGKSETHVANQPPTIIPRTSTLSRSSVDLASLLLQDRPQTDRLLRPMGIPKKPTDLGSEDGGIFSCQENYRRTAMPRNERNMRIHADFIPPKGVTRSQSLTAGVS